MPVIFVMGPSSTWNIPLFAALLLLALVAYASSMLLKDELLFDGTLAADLLALVLLGPIPALAIAASVQLVEWALVRHRPAALLANLAGYAWGIVACSLLIASALGGAPVSIDTAAAAALVVACGVIYTGVGYLFGAVLVGRMLEHMPVRQLRGQLLRGVLPAAMAVSLVSVLCAFLYTQIGILALGVFAGIVLIPQLLLPVLLRPRPVDELSHPEAVALYAQAIAGVMKLDSTQKSILADAAHHIEGPDTQTNGGKIKAEYSGDNFHDVVEAVLYYREHWDSPDGFPGGVGGEMIPLTSRILAVADQWAQLTASGVWTVTHAQAINKLEENSGVQYDPRVVAAAARVVEEERMGLTDNQPQLHEVPLPQLVRKVPRLSGIVSGALSGARSGA